MIENNPQMPWVRDTDGNMIEISSRWLKLTGMSKEHALNAGWLDALHPDDLGPTMKAVREAMHSGNPIDIEYRVKTADGQWKWLRTRGSPRYGPAGEIRRWYGGTEDIDERKELEEAIRSYKAS